MFKLYTLIQPYLKYYDLRRCVRSSCKIYVSLSVLEDKKSGLGLGFESQSLGLGVGLEK